MDHPPPPDGTFGILLIGVIIGAVLYGVSCAQVFYYFHHYSDKDGRGTKAIVIGTMMADTVHQAFISHAIYTYVITYYFHPEKADTRVWSLVSQVVPSAITGFLVQSFYVHRIWQLSHKNTIICGFLFMIISGQLIASFVTAGTTLKVELYADFTRNKSLSLSVTMLAATADVLITIILSFLLYRARSKARRSNTMINILIAFSVQTGFLTSLSAVSAAVLIVVLPNTLHYVFPYFVLCRLYCNSLMAVLNIRDTIRDKGRGGSLGISLQFSSGPNPLSLGNSKGQEIDSKDKIPGAGTHDGNDNLSFVPPRSRMDNSRAVGDFELGQVSS